MSRNCGLSDVFAKWHMKHANQDLRLSHPVIPYFSSNFQSYLLYLTHTEHSFVNASSTGLQSGQYDLLKDIYIPSSNYPKSSWAISVMILAHLLSLMFLFCSYFLPKLVAGGHPAVPVENYIIIRQNETRTVGSCGATSVQRDLASSQDEVEDAWKLI